MKQSNPRLQNLNLTYSSKKSTLKSDSLNLIKSEKDYLGSKLISVLSQQKLFLNQQILMTSLPLSKSNKLTYQDFYLFNKKKNSNKSKIFEKPNLIKESLILKINSKNYPKEKKYWLRNKSQFFQFLLELIFKKSQNLIWKSLKLRLMEETNNSYLFWLKKRIKRCSKL